METLFNIVFFVLWIPLTFIFFSMYKSKTNVISLDGTNGFIRAYAEMLFFSAVGAGAVVAIPLWAIKSVLRWLFG